MRANTVRPWEVAKATRRSTVSRTEKPLATVIRPSPGIGSFSLIACQASIAALDVDLGVEAHRLAILLGDRDDCGVLVLHGLEQRLRGAPLRHMAGGHRGV